MSALQITANIAFLAFPFGIIGLVILWERKALKPFDDAFDQQPYGKSFLCDEAMRHLRGLPPINVERNFHDKGNK